MILMFMAYIQITRFMGILESLKHLTVEMVVTRKLKPSTIVRAHVRQPRIHDHCRGGAVHEKSCVAEKLDPHVPPLCQFPALEVDIPWMSCNRSPSGKSRSINKLALDQQPLSCRKLSKRLTRSDRQSKALVSINLSLPRWRGRVRKVGHAALAASRAAGRWSS